MRRAFFGQGNAPEIPVSYLDFRHIMPTFSNPASNAAYINLWVVGSYEVEIIAISKLLSITQKVNFARM